MAFIFQSPNNRHVLWRIKLSKATGHEGNILLPISKAMYFTIPIARECKQDDLIEVMS